MKTATFALLIASTFASLLGASSLRTLPVPPCYPCEDPPKAVRTLPVPPCYPCEDPPSR